MAIPQHDKQTENVWRERLAAQAASGMTVDQYCRKNGLKASGFVYWQTECARLDRIADWAAEDKAKARAKTESDVAGVVVPLAHKVAATPEAEASDTEGNEAIDACLAAVPLALPLQPPGPPGGYGAGKKATPEKRAFWSAHIEAQASGLDPATTYCTKMGVSYDQFVWWRLKLGGNRPRVAAQREPEAAQPIDVLEPHEPVTHLPLPIGKPNPLAFRWEEDLPSNTEETRPNSEPTPSQLRPFPVTCLADRFRSVEVDGDCIALMVEGGPDIRLLKAVIDVLVNTHNY